LYIRRRSITTEDHSFADEQLQPQYQVVNFARFLAEQERNEAAEKEAPEQGNTKA